MKVLKKNWQYTVWLSPGLILAGITAGLVSGRWQPVPLAIIMSGFVIFGLWLLYGAYEQNFWARRSTKVGGNALVATISVFLILGLLNFLAANYTVRLDLTESQQFSLAPQTEEVLKRLPQPVKLWIFDPNQNPRVKAFLENYQKAANGKFSFEFVDPLREPGKAQEFAINGLGEYQLESGTKRLLVQKGVVVGFDPNQMPTEGKLTNSLEEIFNSRSPKVYFLQGNNERAIQEGQGGIFQAEKSLKDKIYTTAVINLEESKNVPLDADAVIVAGPQKPLSEEEVRALTAYLDRGGSLMLMLDPVENTGLDSLLKDWGVTLEKFLVIDASGNGQRYGLGATVPLAQRYGDHPITQSFGNGTSFYPLARPLELKAVNGIEQKPLIWSSDESWGKSDLKTRNLEFDPKKDRQGPLLLGVALTRTAGNNTQAIPSTSPSTSPSVSPSTSPKASPSGSPSASPKASPSGSPSASPKASPSGSPSASPKASSSGSPSVSPKASSSGSPSVSPKASPSGSPSASPKASPSGSPSASPKASPSGSPSASPSGSPSSSPQASASASPQASPIASSSSPTKESRMVVLGNSQFATNGWFEQQLNGDVFVNSVSWLSNPNQKILSISPKKITNRRINMTLVQAGILILTWLSLPVIGLGIAGTLWWRRR